MLVDDAFAIMDADARVGMTELLQRHMTHIRTVLGTQGNVTVGTKFGGLGAWPGGTFTPIQVRKLCRAMQRPFRGSL